MLAMRIMTLADFPFVMWLKDQAGWNQTESDLRRFLALEPQGCFLAEENGKPVGTVTTCRFDSIAWIGMLLVDPAWRGRGIGRALLMQAMTWVQQQGITNLRLDATALGEPLYRKVGFVEHYRLLRYSGRPSQGLVHQMAVSLFGSRELDLAVRLDQEAYGIDRSPLLTRLFQEWPTGCWCVGNSGYILSRAGSKAIQIGPCIAKDGTSGCALLMHLLGQNAQENVFVDIPQSNAMARTMVEKAGLTPQREFIRMGTGLPCCDKVEWIWASSGPEKG